MNQLKPPITGPMLAVTPFLDRSVVVEHVAGSRAISQLTDGIFSIGIFRLFMRTGFVIIRVASRTIRFETRRSVSWRLIVTFMTIEATDAGPMISGIIG